MNSSGYIKGMALMVLSSVLFSCMSLLVRYAQGINSYLVSLSRFIIGISIITVMSIAGVIRIRAVNKGWLVIRGFFGAVSVMLFFLGIVKIGLGKGTLLNYTYPLFAALFAPLMIGEKVKPDVLVAVAFSFVGIYFIIHPTNMAAFTPFDLLAIAGGVCAGVAVVAIKKLQETDSSYTIFLAQCICGTVVVGAPALGSFVVPSLTGVLVLIGIGIIATVAQLIMTYSYRLVPATEGSLTGFLVPVFNVAAAMLFFREKLDVYMIGGMVAVLVACVYVAFRDRIVSYISEK